MKFKNDVDFTLMNYVHQAWYANESVNREEVNHILKQFEQFPNTPMQLLPMFFAVNYATGTYIIFTNSIKAVLGYDARELLEGGLDFTFSIAQPDYIRSVSNSVFPATVSFLQKTPQEDHTDYVISFNNQMKARNGKWVSVLQKSIYITSKETLLPLYCIGMVVDINAYKKDTTIVHTIESTSQKHGAAGLIETNYFHPFPESTLLTNQEKNIVKYMADGLSTKMIAAKLYISENTVSNHRKNMLFKTNTKNVAQLIAFVIRNHII